MGTQIEVVLSLMSTSAARARARLLIPSYLNFLVIHVQPVVHHLSCPDGLVLREPVLDETYGSPVDGGELSICPLIPLQ